MRPISRQRPFELAEIQAERRAKVATLAKVRSEVDSLIQKDGCRVSRLSIRALLYNLTQIKKLSEKIPTFIIYINKQSFLVQKLEQLLGAALRFDSKNLTHL